MPFLICIILTMFFYKCNLIEAFYVMNCGNVEELKKSPGNWICQDLTVTVELFKVVEEYKPDLENSSKMYHTYKIIVEEIFNKPAVTLDNIIVTFNEDFFSEGISLIVGKSYVATVGSKLIIHNNNRPIGYVGKVGSRVGRLHYCYNWYKEWNKLNDEQQNWLRGLKENCNKDVPFPDDSEPGFLEIYEWILLFVIIVGFVFVCIFSIVVTFLNTTPLFNKGKKNSESYSQMV
jgi:hypothetical protein